MADVGPPTLGGRVDARQVEMFLVRKLAATFAGVAAVRRCLRTGSSKLNTAKAVAFRYCYPNAQK